MTTNENDRKVAMFREQDQAKVRQVLMFGVPEADLVAVRNDRMELDGACFGRAGVDARAAQSILSDAQELMAMGRTEEARTAINRAKWFLEQLKADLGPKGLVRR